MTHDRDGWPDGERSVIPEGLINGIYRVVGEPPREPQPPYADLEQRVPEAWDPDPESRSGMVIVWGFAALAVVIGGWWVWVR